MLRALLDFGLHRIEFTLQFSQVFHFGALKSAAGGDAIEDGPRPFL
jgi:hypothetical protein